MTGSIYRAIIGAAMTAAAVWVLWLVAAGLATQAPNPGGGLGFTGNIFAAAQAAPADKLTKVEAKVDTDFAGVKQLTAPELEALRKSGKPVILFDVREASEYAVSHIPGAQRVDPGIWSWSFMRKNAKLVKGKTVVFYCSVGVRSSKLAERLQKELAAKGAVGTYNLRGGVFRWHNDKRPLLDAKGKTPLVHPYDRYWGKLVNRQNYISYKPAKP